MNYIICILDGNQPISSYQFQPLRYENIPAVAVAHVNRMCGSGEDIYKA